MLANHGSSTTLPDRSHSPRRDRSRPLIPSGVIPNEPCPHGIVARDSQRCCPYWLLPLRSRCLPTRGLPTLIWIIGALSLPTSAPSCGKATGPWTTSKSSGSGRSSSRYRSSPTRCYRCPARHDHFRFARFAFQRSSFLTGVGGGGSTPDTPCSARENVSRAIIRNGPPCVAAFSSSPAAVPAHQFAPLLHQPQLQHLGLCFDVISIGLRALGSRLSRRKYRR